MEFRNKSLSEVLSGGLLFLTKNLSNISNVESGNDDITSL